MCLPRERKARVWIDATPDTWYPVERVHARMIPVASPVNGPPPMRVVAVEDWIPAGTHALYALLGASWLPPIGAGDSRLHIEVLSAVSQEGNWLRWTFDLGACPGLTDEFASAILDGAEAEAALLGPGILRFERGAWSAIGSSETMFRRLGGALVRLLARRESGPVSVDEARALLAG